MPMTRTELDKVVAAGCQQPGCNCKGQPISFHPGCHPNSPTWASYFDGTLYIQCAECRSPIAAVAVGSEAIPLVLQSGV